MSLNECDNDNEQLVFCKYCKYFKFSGNYEYVSSKFIDSHNPNEKPRISGGYQMNYWSKICKHSNCFKWNIIIKPTKLIKVKQRVNGQGMLNWNNKCSLFKPNFITKIRNWIKI